MWARRAEFAPAWPKSRQLGRCRAGIRRQGKPDLPAAGELDIDLREQLRVEERAVQHAVTAVDPVTHAKRVERMLRARMAPPRERERVDHTLDDDFGMAASTELVVEKAEIELRVMRDERRVLQEIEQFERMLVKALLIGKEGVRQPVDLLGGERHRPLRIEIGVESAPGRHA